MLNGINKSIFLKCNFNKANMIFELQANYNNSDEVVIKNQTN